jgi:hypothetical protein
MSGRQIPRATAWFFCSTPNLNVSEFTINAATAQLLSHTAYSDSPLSILYFFVSQRLTLSPTSHHQNNRNSWKPSEQQNELFCWNSYGPSLRLKLLSFIHSFIHSFTYPFFLSFSSSLVFKLPLLLERVFSITQIILTDLLNGAESFLRS